MDIHLSKKDLSLFKIAKEATRLSNHRYKLGAVLYYHHKIIAYSSNSNDKTDPIQAELDKEKFACECPGKLHAESALLIPFIKRHIDVSGSELYIYRIKKDGSRGMARPCTSCMKLIRSCKIKKIYYSTDDGFAKELII